MDISRSILKKRLAKLEATSWQWGDGNPETMSYTTMGLMRNDPWIRIGLSVIKLPILSADWVLESESEELKEFVQKYVIDRFFNTLLEQALLALDYGFSAQEKVYMNEDGYLVPREYVNPLPNNVVIMIDREFGGYEGIKVMGRGGAVEIPAGKTWLFNNDQESNNYYGRSVLKSAYRPWYGEQLTNVAMLRHLEYHGSPISVLYFPADLDENDNLKYKSIADNIIENIPYQREIAVPNLRDELGKDRLWEFEMVAGEVRATQYVEAINLLNKEKLLGLLVPAQIIDRMGETGSFAEDASKANTLMLMVQGLMSRLASGINDHVIEQVVNQNFNTTDEVVIKPLPLTGAKQEALAKFTGDMLRIPGNATDDVVGACNEYALTMLKGKDAATDAPAGKGEEDEVPDEEKESGLGIYLEAPKGWPPEFIELQREVKGDLQAIADKLWAWCKNNTGRLRDAEDLRFRNEYEGTVHNGIKRAYILGLDLQGKALGSSIHKKLADVIYFKRRARRVVGKQFEDLNFKLTNEIDRANKYTELTPRLKVWVDSFKSVNVEMIINGELVEAFNRGKDKAIWELV